MAKKSSLGPFPKTRSLVLIAKGEASAVAVIDECRDHLEALLTSEDLVTAAVFFVSLPVAGRVMQNPSRAELPHALDNLLPREGFGRRVALGTLNALETDPRLNQASAVPQDAWRIFDGSAFCDLGRQFFACVTEQLLSEHLERHVDEEIKRMAWEMSTITRAFSARWYNKCAVGQEPDRGSVRWYLGHCLGKLDLEFERELPGHTEQTYVSRKQRAAEPPSLGLPLGL